MTDDIQAIRDDIAYLKALAQGGQDSVSEGGMILIAAGGFYGLASLVQWASLARVSPVTPAMANWAWLAALVLFFTTLFVAKRRQARSGQRSQASGMAWTGIGWGLFVIFCAIALATWRTRTDLLIRFSPAIVLTLYGAAWMVAAMVTRKTWLWLTAAGSFVGALISAWLIKDTAQYLFYAFALFLLAFLPGVVFVLAARRSAVGVE